MNNMIAKIQDKINARTEEIKQLIKAVREVIGDNGSVEVDVGGTGFVLESEVVKFGGKKSDNVSVRFTNAIVHEHEDGTKSYDWGISDLEMPEVGWQWKCLADKAWDYKSYDIETLEVLKRKFDFERAEMDNIRKALEAFKASKKEVYDFFA